MLNADVDGGIAVLVHQRCYGCGPISANQKKAPVNIPTKTIPVNYGMFTTGTGYWPTTIWMVNSDYKSVKCYCYWWGSHSLSGIVVMMKWPASSSIILLLSLFWWLLPFWRLCHSIQQAHALSTNDDNENIHIYIYIRRSYCKESTIWLHVYDGECLWSVILINPSEIININQWCSYLVDNIIHYWFYTYLLILVWSLRIPYYLHHELPWVIRRYH